VKGLKTAGKVGGALMLLYLAGNAIPWEVKRLNGTVYWLNKIFNSGGDANDQGISDPGNYSMPPEDFGTSTIPPTSSGPLIVGVLFAVVGLIAIGFLVWWFCFADGDQNAQSMKKSQASKKSQGSKKSSKGGSTNKSIKSSNSKRVSRNSRPSSAPTTGQATSTRSAKSPKSA